MSQKVIWFDGRVSVKHPGKHGENDYRVEFNGEAPTHREIISLLAWVFCAERRYNKPGQEGPHMLMGYLDEALHADSLQSLQNILDRVDATKPATGTCNT